MRIYLAGKMDELGNWRDSLLDAPPGTAGKPWHAPTRGGWDYPWNDDNPAVAWPQGPNTLVLGTHDYTGPYRCELVDGDSGSTGVLHGNEGRGQHGSMESMADRRQIFTLCEMAIRRCDLFFAYVNDFDSFGTFAEIGIACALNKHVVVIEHEDAIGTDRYHENENDTDLWFVGACAHRHILYKPTRQDGAGYEGFFLRTILLEEISRCSVHVAQAERRKTVNRQIWEQATDSFQQIIRWTSDPRVRDEARRMIRYLDPSGVIAS